MPAHRHNFPTIRRLCALGVVALVGCGGGDADRTCVSSEAGPYCYYPPAPAAVVTLSPPVGAKVGVPATFFAEVSVASARINSVAFCVFSNEETVPYDACQFEDLMPIQAVSGGEQGTLSQVRTLTRSGPHTYRVLAFSAAENRQNTLATVELVFSVAP